MAIAEARLASQPQSVLKVPRGVPTKNSIIILGTFEPKYKLIHSMYIALTKLSELGLAESPALFENNVVAGSSDELDYARLSFKVGRKRKEKWLVGIRSDISSKILADMNSAIKALRGELPEEVEVFVNDVEELERLFEGARRFVYVYDASSQLYASLEMSSMIVATEGRKVEKMAIVSMGRGGVPAFAEGSLKAMKELGYLKEYLVVEVPTLNSFEMLKLTKFLLF